MFDLKIDDTLHIRLPDLCNASVCDMLAQQHTEIRRSHRTWLVVPGQINERKGSTCGEEQTLLSVLSF